MDYEDLRRLFIAHEYRTFQGGYACFCGWSGSNQSEHMADVALDYVMGAA